MKKAIISLLTFVVVINTKPVLQNGQFYLPLRTTLESIGYTVYYDDNITASTKGDQDLLVINSNTDTYINYMLLQEIKEPVQIGDQLFVPVELLNSLGYDVTYNVTEATTILEDDANAN